MALPSARAYETIVNYLGPHGPDALLAFVIFAGVIGAGLAGLDLWFSGLVGIGIYLIYAVRRSLAEKHQERSAEQEVAKRELELKIYRDRQLMKVEREKLKALPPARSREGKK
ncbi:hypothetical protein HNR60_001305 [Rhodopseudomonas rhenobacensis]|uniref:Uncharacterized protein n=1 Tax=Rhodopseudomonas rhenobacensis TaxID=87461 RepID=A0A7W7Z2N5_9BRAD|nr:hypothetical protein [Rhodopseudomonas rhenobacensis]MBB5046557.1 hypothetical protein [Rhodopseudomonas rhenobacensis]